VTKRLQVLLDTTAGWVRRRLRHGAAAGSRPDTASRLSAIHAAYRHASAAPAPDIDQMLDEIERGYLPGGPTP
jgi:hypothetical protein